MRPLVAPTLAPFNVDADNETLDDALALSGSGTPGSTVQVLRDGESVETVTVDEAGSWTAEVGLDAIGDYQLAAQTLDDEGNPVETSATLTVSRIRPIEAPTLTAAATELTADTLALSGSGTPGSVIQILRDGDLVGTTQADDDGGWSLVTLLPDLGDYQLSAQALDKTGQVAESSEALTVSRVRPLVAPTLAPFNVDADNETTDDILALSGSGTPGSTVQVLRDGESVETVMVDETGSWTAEVGLETIGDYQLAAQTLGAEGNPVETSATLTVSRVRPIEAPILAAAAAELTADTLALSGSGTPGSVIQVHRDGALVGTTQADDDGRWSLVTLLPDLGDYQLSAQALDKRGMVAGSSEALTVSRVLPIDAPTIALADISPETTRNAFTLIGKGTPGSTIRVLLNGQSVGTTPVDETGGWSLQAALLDLGDYQIQAEALDAAGTVSAISDPLAVARVSPFPPFTFNIAPPLTIPIANPTLQAADRETTADIVTLFGAGTTGSTLEILRNGTAIGSTTIDAERAYTFDAPLPDLGDYQLVAQVVDEAGEILALSNAVHVDRVRPIEAPTLTAATKVTADPLALSGSGTPGSVIQVLRDGELVGTTQADDDGGWSLVTLLPELGEHQLLAQALDKRGQVAGSSETLTVSRVRPLVAPTLAPFNVDADNETTDDVLALSGSGTPGSTVMVLRDGAAVTTAEVDETGSWTAEVALETLGDYQLAAQTLDAEGNSVETSAILTVSRVRPIEAPTLTSAVTEVTADPLALSGSGTPGSVIQILRDGELAGTTQADDDGRWSLVTLLPELGEHQLLAQALDKTGAVAGSSDSLTVSRVRPLVAPTLAPFNVDADNETTENFLVISGTGTPGSTVQLLSDGETIGTREVDETGSWTAEVGLEAIGDYQLAAQTLDDEGNPVETSATLTISRIRPIEAPTLTAAATELTADPLALNGSGTPGSVIQILRDGELAGTTQADDDGRWSLVTLLTELGEHQLLAQALDKRGQVAGSSETLTVSRVRPLVAPTLAPFNVDADNETTDDALALSGSGTPGSTVQVLRDGEPVETVTVDETGSWTAEVGLEAIGDYQLAAQTLDDEGNPVETSATLTASRVRLIEAPTLTTAATEVTADPLALSGSGTPGSVIQILRDGELTGTTQADDDGRWSLVTLLSDLGEHQLLAQALDKSGAVAGSSETLTVSRVRPLVAPTLAPFNVDADNETTDDALALSGSGTPGSTVQVLRDGEPVETVTVDETGNWSVEVALETIGDYQLAAQTLDDEGNPVETSATLTASRVRPIEAPTLTATATEVTADPLALSGSGTPGSVIRLLVDTIPAGVTRVDEGGNWAFIALLSELGEHIIIAQALDKQNQVAGVSDPLVVTRVLPIRPPTVGLADARPDAELAEERITLVGQATPDSEVEILVDDESVGSARVDTEGNWSFETTLPELGLHEITAHARNEAGELLYSNLVLINRVRPIVVPTFEPVNVNAFNELTDDTLSLTGQGTPNSFVQILIDGNLVGTTQVDERGQWATEVRLTELGDHQLSTQALNTQGEIATRAAPITISRIRAIVPPTIALVNVDDDNETTDETLAIAGTGTPESWVQMMVNGEIAGTAQVDVEGNWTFSVDLPDFAEYTVSATALDARGDVAATSDTLVASRIRLVEAPTLIPTNTNIFDELTGPDLTIIGSGTPGSAIRLVLDDEPVGTTQVDGGGAWSFTIPLPDLGDYAVRAEALDKFGDLVGPSDELIISRIRPIIAPTIGLINVDADNETTDNVLAVAGGATPDSPVQIVLNDEIAGTTRADDAGSWSFEAALPDFAEYTITAQALDARGSVVESSETLTAARIRSVEAPTLAVITSQAVSDPVIMAGKGTPGAVLQILVNERVAGTTEIDRNGNWSFVTLLATPGGYQINAQTLDKFGEVAGISETNTITKVPPIIAPTLVVSATELTDNALTLSGTGTPGSTVRVLLNNSRLGTTSVNPDGRWSLDTAIEAPGHYTLQAEALDPNGNVVGRSEQVAVNRLTAPSFFFPADGADIIAGELTLIGTGEPGVQVEIWDAEALLGPTVVDDNGEWRFRLEVTQGDYAFAARFPGAEGASSTVSAQVVNADENRDCTLNPGLIRGGRYIVGTCDTLGTISDILEVDFREVLDANPQIEDPNLIYPGDTLLIP